MQEPNRGGRQHTRPARTLRERDADTVRRSLADARQAVENLHTAWGVWADDVRQDAEQRHGPDATNETLWADPEYSLALDGGQPIWQAKEAVHQASAWFARAEPETPQAEAAGPEAEL